MEVSQQNLERLKKKSKKLPPSCGVYLMKDNAGKIIYVGKAKNLRNRVSSYFIGINSHDNKTRHLVADISNFEVMLVDTEVESLILERSLIKTHYPKYNILLKDGKEFPYIKIDLNHPWPRVEKVRLRKADGATYLGPYGNVGYVNTMLRIVHKIFPIVKCSDYEFKNAKRPCNYFHFNQCLAPCVLSVDPDAYSKTIEDTIDFLKGNNKKVREKIKSKMKIASSAEEFEIAARYRDQLEALENFIQKQAVAFENIENCDAVGIEIKSQKASIHIVQVRDHIITNRDNFLIESPYNEKANNLLFDFILQYYDLKYVPELILTSHPVEDKEVLAEAIKTTSELNASGKVKITTGYLKEEKDVIAISQKNAIYVLEEELRKEKSSSISLKLIKEEINLKNTLHRIECIDISNMGGTAIVASCVCFINGKPSKNHYRKYNIHDENNDGPDDFEAMRFVVKKRLERAIRENDCPDLLLIDGGKGQLTSALEVKKDFPDLKLEIISLAKSRLEQAGSYDHNYQTHSNERLIIPGREQPTELKVGSPAYRLFTQIRDEAHRFAITHHRKRRSKIRHTSLLEKIDGVGPATRKKLFDKFGSLEVISNASVESLMQIKGISEDKAVAIKSYLAENLKK